MLQNRWPLAVLVSLAVAACGGNTSDSGSGGSHASGGTGGGGGAPFPAGVYTLDVSAIGTHSGQSFKSDGQLTVTLTP